jgi:hypothetical protein
MKKFIAFAVVIALLVPAAAFAVTEFSLGGFIKLDAMWDSNNGVGKNLNGVPARNNNGDANHGRLKFTAQGSRFNFTIKGPKLWGADVTGFLEMDFDAAENGLTATSGNTGTAVLATPQGVAFGGASKSYTPRMRHAMFRFNWPTSELLFGQYFSMFSEWYVESAEDGPFQMTGTPTARLPQIRFTQKFLGDWTVAALIGDPNQATLGNSVTGSYNAAINNGQSAETPQIQAKVTYAHDFWGKAAYYGKPIPFTASLVAGWQRNVMRQGTFATSTLGSFINSAPIGATENALPATVGLNVQNQYVNPWMLMGSLFIPVIPTSSANLAGTAHILTNWWIGQGVECFGFTGVTSNLYKFSSFIPNSANGVYDYEAMLLKKFGGVVEGQYYFNNQWFLNAAYGISKAFNVSRARYLNVNTYTAINGMEWAMGDNAQTIQQVALTLWYRPIQAIKFGLQYEYAAAHYYQYINATNGPAVANIAGAAVNPANAVNRSAFGSDHRVEFVGFFYF